MRSKRFPRPGKLDPRSSKVRKLPDFGLLLFDVGVAVRPYLSRDPGERALFLDHNGRRLKNHVIARRLTRYADRARLDVNVTPHTFRRSCTTELIRSGANLYHVKELLGHESLDTVRHYAKLTIADLKETHAKCHPRERENV